MDKKEVTNAAGITAQEAEVLRAKGKAVPDGVNPTPLGAGLHAKDAKEKEVEPIFPKSTKKH